MPSSAPQLATHAPRPGSAMDRAKAEIAHAFGFPAVLFKQRVRRFIRRGAGDPANRARYSARTIALVNRDIDRAIVMVEHWFQRERKAFQIANAFGSGVRLSTMVLAEMRLVLRFMRARKLKLQPVIADVLGDYAQAAE